METTGKKQNYWDKEMQRLTGNIPESRITQLKGDLADSIDYYTSLLESTGNLLPPEIDMWNYRKDHNYIDITVESGELNHMCRQGIEYLFKDFHDAASTNKDIILNDLLPGVFVNDLVVRQKVKADDNSSRPASIYYHYMKYDPEDSIMYYSLYERIEPQLMDKGRSPLAVTSTKGTDAVYDGPQIIHSLSWAIPAECVFSILFVGMHGLWKDISFLDYPAFASWEPSEPFAIYSSHKNQMITNFDEDHSFLMDAVEMAFGFHRYLINLADNRERVEIIPDKERSKILKKPITPEEKKEYNKNKKSIVSLTDAIRIYTHDQASVKQMRKPKKCEYRYSVREHYRHYRNGKIVKVRGYDKNKNLPFKPHKYVI